MKADITLGLSRVEAEVLEEVLEAAASERESRPYGRGWPHLSLTIRALDVEPIYRRLAMLLRNPAA